MSLEIRRQDKRLAREERTEVEAADLYTDNTKAQGIHSVFDLGKNE